MKVVLDTDVVSNRRRKQPHLAVASWLNRQDADTLMVTVATVMELQRGIERARAAHPGSAQLLGTWLQSMIRDGSPEILPMTTSAARVVGRMYETPALRHVIITDPRAARPAAASDLAIAAMAIAAGAVLATGNVRHFLQIHLAFPLPGLFDPFSQTWHAGGP